MNKKHILNKHFDNIYLLYISNTELANAKYKINYEGLNVQYFLGVDGKSCDEYNDVAKKQAIKKKHDDNTIIFTKGQYGHIRSFINILIDAINNGHKKILILEADIYFSHNFSSLFNYYNNIKYKILYLGCSQHSFYSENTWLTVKKQNPQMNEYGYYHPYNTLGTFAIGLHCDVFTEYYILLKSMLLPSDMAIFELQKKYYYESFVIYPNIICCNLVKSSTFEGQRYVVQIDKMIKYEWILHYTFHDYYVICIKPHVNYNLCLEINSIMLQPQIKLKYFDGTDVLFASKNIYRDDQTVYINFVSTQSKISMTLIDVFINSYSLKVIYKK